MRASISRGPPRGRSEGGRALGGDSEGALEGDADAAECAFLEEVADQGDAVRHTARWRKLGQSILRIGRPVRTSLRTFDKAGTEGERRTTGSDDDPSQC